jgi:hypothetical protein
MRLFGVATHDVQPLLVNASSQSEFKGKETDSHESGTLNFSCERMLWKSIHGADDIERAYGATKWNTCKHIRKKWIPPFTPHQPEYIQDKYPPGSGVVCFPELVAGIGWLTDHCDDEYQHGRRVRPETDESLLLCNAGRGRDFWMLRNFLMSGAGLNPKKTPCAINILFSTRVADYKFMSTKNWHAMASLAEKKLGVRARALELAKFSVNDQMYLVSQSTVYVTVCGGGAHTGIFLPWGASLIIFCPHKNRDYPTTAGTHEDASLWNSLPYVSSVTWIGTHNHNVKLKEDSIMSVLEGVMQVLLSL